MAYTPPKYPDQIPTEQDLPDWADDLDWVYALIANYPKKELRAALIELGTNPRLDKPDVKTLLTCLYEFQNNLLGKTNIDGNSSNINYDLNKIIIPMKIQYIRDKNLVGYWSLAKKDYINGKIIDLSGHGNNGIFHGEVNPTFAPDHNGKEDGAIKFDGDNDYVNCGNGEGLNITGKKITMEGWVKWKGTGVSWQHLVYKGGKYKIYVTTSNGRPTIGIATSAGYVGVNATSPIATNDWSHVVGVYDGDAASGEQMKIYIDGVLKGQGSQTGNIETTTAVLEISRRTGNPFNGPISQTRIWNRALTPDEVQHLT